MQRPLLVAANASLTPSLGVTRSFADPGDFDAWAISLGATGIYALSPDLGLFAAPAAYYRNYDHYFPQLVGVRREDTGVAMALGLSWTPLPPVVLTAQISTAYNYSTVGFNVYTAFIASPALRLKIAF